MIINLKPESHILITPVSQALKAESYLGFFCGIFMSNRDKAIFLNETRFVAEKSKNDNNTEKLHEEGLFLKRGQKQWLECSRWLGANEERLVVISSKKERISLFGDIPLSPEEAGRIALTSFSDSMSWYPG